MLLEKSNERKLRDYNHNINTKHKLPFKFEWLEISTNFYLSLRTCRNLLKNNLKISEKLKNKKFLDGKIFWQLLHI